jgi:hypothetical protein
MLRSAPTLLVPLAVLAGCAAHECPAQPALPAAPAPAPAPAADPQRALILEDSPGEQALGERGWSVSGGARDAYVVHRDGPGGRTAWLLEPFRDTFGKYGTWMRHVPAADYRGKRVRVTATLRTQGATRRVDFWARAQAKDSPGDGLGLGGDRESLPADADFASHAIVLDVPADAEWLEYGIGLAGPGRIWLESTKVETVGGDVPVTRPLARTPPAARASVPGWTLSGDGAHDYAGAIDGAVMHGGRASGTLRAVGAAPKGSAALSQWLEPQPYRGKRLRLRAFVKADKVTGRAGLWLRVDAPGAPGAEVRWTAFDDMEDRPIRGTSDWTRHEVVLDVAPDAAAIAFGVQLEGPGQVWIDDVSFDVVDAKVKTTGRRQRPRGQGDNLDFEQ